MTFANRMLSNRYRLTVRIAAGGMGEVWRATDSLLGRDVAVKVLRQHVAADPEFRERFRNEARITAGLADPGIAQVFDYGEQDEIAYLVMELVSGEPLSTILARNGTLSPEVTLDVLGQTARALFAAHRSGVIHRDVKPGNLLVTETGIVKITDFGIARALEGSRMTMTGTVLGTAQYVSPEQASGSVLTPSTDLYSLGVVAYECLVGHPPFMAGNQVAIALLHLNEQVPELPDSVPKPVRDLVVAMLAKSPDHRPATAQELADRTMVLRDSLATPNVSHLSMLTDPSGYAIREALDQAADPFAELYEDTPATMPPPPGPTRIGRPPSGPRHPGPPAPTGQRRRRSTIGLFAAAGAAAAVGFGALAAAGGIPELILDSGPAQPSGPVTGVPTRSPSPVKVSKTSLRPEPVKSVKPTWSRSVTVSRSATPTRGRTPKPTPSPTPTPIPTPTPTPEPSETPSPTSSASTTIPPNGET